MRAFGWNRVGDAKAFTRHIRPLAPELHEAFIEFWNTKRVQRDLRVGDFTLGELVDIGLSPIAAFLALDWIVKDPENGPNAVRRLLRRACNPPAEGSFVVSPSWVIPKPKLPEW